VHDGKHEYSPQRHASCGGGGQVTAINVGALLAKLADRDIQQRDMEPDEGMEIENRIAMGRRLSTSFRRRGARPALRLHVPRLQRLADERERQQLSVPRRSRVDRGCATQGAPWNVAQAWRYTDLADEAERAVTVIGRRLSEATSGAGECGDG
jgi:two-component system, chemotaxis family, protein-glutamate methylesterase/glutaminase